MSVNQLSNPVILYRHSDQSDHLREVGEWLRDEHNCNNRRFMDVQLLMNGQDEYLHSAVAFLLATQAPPITIDLGSCNAQSVSKVVDWIYNGEVQMHQQTIAEDLEAAAVLGVDALHHQLECTFYQMALYIENRIPSLNIAMNERYGISPSLRRRLLAEVARVAEKLSVAEIRGLSLQTITAITGCQEVTAKEKIALLNLVVQWYAADENLQHMASMISTIRSNLINSIPADESQPPTLSFRPPRTASQHLVNARQFSSDEVAEYNRLPPTRELFPPRNFRPSPNDQWIKGSSRGSKNSAFFAPDSTNCTSIPSSNNASLKLPPIKHDFPRPNSPSQIPSVVYNVNYNPRKHDFPRPLSSSSIRSDAYVVGKHAFERPEGPADLESDAYEVSGASQCELSDSEVVVDRFQHPKGSVSIPSEDYVVGRGQSSCHATSIKDQRSQTDYDDYRRLPNPFVPNNTFSHPQLSHSDMEILQNLPDVFAEKSKTSEGKSKKKTPNQSISTAVEYSGRTTSVSSPKCPSAGEYRSRRRPSKKSSGLNTARSSSVKSNYADPRFQESFYAYEKDDN
ncbi:BTB domain-containing protein [Aphelenchoides besseyi]|nr:BTB domain-containing protein [Aphelenchoides besseyi]KAI6210813.1 BTB domain-containing protein [Aphelenchoides besseyi]